jgi:cytochrome c-type biogenesis protein CcmH/NrfG
MTRKRDVVFGIFALLIIGSLIYVVSNYIQNKTRTDLAKRIAALSPRGGPPETIEGLRQAIALYEAQIEQHVKDAAQTGVYWKILAIRLKDRGMHRDALDAFERSVQFYPDDPTLFYLIGDSASVVAASIVGFSGNSGTEKEHYTRLAETSYLRSIQLDPAYPRPRLGLGILYTFDQNRAAEAVPHLERYVELAPNDVKGMFVLARAYFMTENYDRAVELYDRIIARTKDPKVRSEAQNNKDTIRNLMYGR